MYNFFKSCLHFCGTCADDCTFLDVPDYFSELSIITYLVGNCLCVVDSEVDLLFVVHLHWFVLCILSRSDDNGTVAKDRSQSIL